MNGRAADLTRRAAWLLLLGLGLGACRVSAPSASTTVAVDSEFESAWRRAGGLSTFGPPISAGRREGRVLRQTFLAVELISDEAGVRLAPLGRELGLSEPPVAPLAGQKAAYFESTGHSVYPGFAAYYARLGGESVIGPPISEAVFRDGQIVQYFENAGLYRAESASPAETRMVALGLTARPPEDSFGLDPRSLVLRGRVSQRPFGGYLQQFGGEAVVGQPLTEPYRGADGAIEQVYERVVVYSADGSARRAGIRPLGVGIGPPDPPASPAGEAGSLFFRETGHNVRWAFADFYRRHEGRELLGAPLEEADVRNGVLAQRFEKATLYYDFTLPEALAVQLARLGAAYLQANPPPVETPAPGPSPTPTSIPETTPEGLAVHASVRASILPPGTSQQLAVSVTGGDGGPVVGALVSAWVIEPTGSRQIRFPATDEQGLTTQEWLDPAAVPGEIVVVEVEARLGGAAGTARALYAHGFPARP